MKKNLATQRWERLQRVKAKVKAGLNQEIANQQTDYLEIEIKGATRSELIINWGDLADEYPEWHGCTFKTGRFVIERWDRRFKEYVVESSAPDSARQILTMLTVFNRHLLEPTLSRVDEVK